MSQFKWPHPAYAEDQPYAKSLLYVHVFHRGFEVGAGIGLLISGWKLTNSIIPLKPLAPPPSPSAMARIVNPAAIDRIVYPAVGKASLIGGGVTMALLTVRMWGLEDIEWKDRSWRLLENKGQVMHDKYCDWGAGLGVAHFFAERALGLATGRPGILSVQMAGRVGMGAVTGAIVCEIVRAVS